MERETEHTVVTVRQLSAVLVLYISSIFLVSFSCACIVSREVGAAVNTNKVPNSTSSPNSVTIKLLEWITPPTCILSTSHYVTPVIE